MASRAALAGLVLMLWSAGVTGSPSPRSPWGCEPGLPPGAFHLVVATARLELHTLHQWLPHVGLTNAHIYVYHRAPAAAEPVFHLPCNMSVFTRLLEPNGGREAAVITRHIAAFYDSPPLAFAFTHSHGPLSRHSQCGAFFRRLRRIQRDMATTTLQPASAAIPDIVSLNSGCFGMISCCSMFCGRNETCQTAKWPSGCQLHMARFYSTMHSMPHDVPLHLAVHEDMPHQLYSSAADHLKEPEEKGLDNFNKLLASYNVSKDAAGLAYVPTWSCCSQYVIRRQAVLKYDKNFYMQALNVFLMDSVMQGRGWEWATFGLFDEERTVAAVYNWYMSTDVLLSHMYGCPVHRRSISLHKKAGEAPGEGPALRSA